MYNPSNVTRRAKEQAEALKPIVSNSPDLRQYSAEKTEFHQINLLEPDQATVPISPCRSCGATQGVQIPGRGPHYAGLKCATCGRWIKWVGKLKGEA